MDYWGKGTMVTVSSATARKPTVFPLMPCGSGTDNMVTLGCLATSFTPAAVTFSWTKNGVALPDFVQYPPTQNGNFYTGVSHVQVNRRDWDANQPFQCAVSHTAGNTDALIRKPKEITRLPDLKVFAYSGQDNEASFLCFAQNFAPKKYEIKWLKNAVEITDKISEIITQLDDKKGENGTLYGVASILTVPSSDVSDGAEIACQFKGRDSTGGVDFQKASLTYSSKTTETPGCPSADVNVYIEEPTMEGMFLHKKGTLICHVEVKANTVDKIYWEDENKKEMPNPLINLTRGQKTYALPLDITFDEWSQGIKRVCIVESKDWLSTVKTTYERNIGGVTLRPSVFMLPPIEHTKTETVTLSCYMKDFYPQDIFVSWLADDEVVDSKYDFNTTEPVKLNGAYSAYGQLSLSQDQWTRNDVVYSCVVYHLSVVNSTNAIVRSIAHRSFDKINLVNLNMNIPETCKAQ